MNKDLFPQKLTLLQEDFLVGNLLGDGSLFYLKKGVNKNSKFSIQQKLAFSEYVKFLQKIYYPFATLYSEGKRKKPSRINGKISHEILKQEKIGKNNG